MPRPDGRPAVSVEREMAPVAERVRELPHPVRTRILLELAGDVEELTRDLRRAGLGEEEAARRAAERVVPSEAALDALVRLHRPIYRRLVEPLPDPALRRWERGALLATTTFVLAAGVIPLGRSGLLDAPSPFLWAVLILAGGVAGLVLAKGFQLFVRRDHRPERLDRGLGALLALSGAALLVAGAGTVIDLWALAATLEAGVPDPAPLLTAWLLRESVLLAAALLTAIAGGLGWFLLAQAAAAVRLGDQEVRRTLGAAPVTADPGSGSRPSKLAPTEAGT